MYYWIIIIETLVDLLRVIGLPQSQSLLEKLYLLLPRMFSSCAG